jgi:hypothetical protein
LGGLRRGLETPWTCRRLHHWEDAVMNTVRHYSDKVKERAVLRVFEQEHSYA